MSANSSKTAAKKIRVSADQRVVGGAALSLESGGRLDALPLEYVQDIAVEVFRVMMLAGDQPPTPQCGRSLRERTVPKQKDRRQKNSRNALQSPVARAGLTSIRQSSR